MSNHKYPCVFCDGDGHQLRTTATHPNDPNGEYLERCEPCEGTGRSLCDNCSREATVEAWTREDPKSREAAVSLLCDRHLAASRADGTFLMLAVQPAGEKAHEAIAAACARTEVRLHAYREGLADTKTLPAMTMAETVEGGR